MFYVTTLNIVLQTAVFLTIKSNNYITHLDTRVNFAKPIKIKEVRVRMESFYSVIIVIFVHLHTFNKKLPSNSSISKMLPLTSSCTSIKHNGALSFKSNFVFKLSHERAKCVYAHNFQDFRRNPRKYKYKVRNSLNLAITLSILEQNR